MPTGWRMLADNGSWSSAWVHVNPIPLNDIPGSQFTRSREEDMDEFVRRSQPPASSPPCATPGSDMPPADKPAAAE